MLTYVHSECIGECELFLVASVNLVNRDPFTWFFAPPSFPSYLFFSRPPPGHLRPFFFFFNLGSCGILLSRVSTFVLRVRPCLVALGVLLPTSWDASEHHPSSCYQVTGYALFSFSGSYSELHAFIFEKGKERKCLPGLPLSSSIVFSQPDAAPQKPDSLLVQLSPACSSPPAPAVCPMGKPCS